MFICGSALTGQPDNGNLAGATLCGPVKTAARYRMHAVGNGRHPGIYATSSGGVSIAGELYSLTPEQYAHLESTEPPGLYAASIELDDGRSVTAFLYPQADVEANGWPDVSEYGGWAAYKSAQ